MGWTKKQYINQAFEEIGLASYVFDLTPEQINSALRRLDAMIALWIANGIRFNWDLTSKPNNSDLDKEVNVPDSAHEAIYLNLAIRLAPSFGKIVPNGLITMAQQAYASVMSTFAEIPPEMTFPRSLPLGAGNKTWRTGVSPFAEQQVVQVETTKDGSLNFE
jgi:hypothetical protein